MLGLPTPWARAVNLCTDPYIRAGPRIYGSVFEMHKHDINCRLCFVYSSCVIVLRSFMPGSTEGTKEARKPLCFNICYSTNFQFSNINEDREIIKFLDHQLISIN